MDLTRASAINGYKSSLELSPLIKAYGKGEEGAAEALLSALDRISKELETLSEKGDPRLLAEIGPWLEKARAYIDAACAVASFDRAENASQRGEAAMRYAAGYKRAFGNSSAVSRDLLEPFVFEARARFSLLSGKSVLTDLPVYQNYLPENAIDGDPSTFFWSSEAPAAGSVFTIDLGGVYDVSGVRPSMGNDARRDDYLRKGVIEYSADGKTYVKLCDVGGRTVESAEVFSARCVRLRCTGSQSNRLIISEFSVRCGAELPDGVSFDGEDPPDVSPLFDRSLLSVFSPDPKSVSGKTLRIDLTGAKTAEIYLSSLAGVRIYTLDADGNPGGDLPLAPYKAFDPAGAAQLCLEFSEERAEIAEIVIG